MDLVGYSKIITYPSDIATLMHACNYMHSRVIYLSMAYEALKSSTWSRILFNDGYMHAFL